MAKQVVTGEEYFELDGQLTEIKRQLRQPNGYPFMISDLRTALQNIIEGHLQNMITNDGSQFPTWKTIKLGTHSTVEELKDAIINAGHGLISWSAPILDEIAYKLATEEYELDLVKVTGRMLGFRNRAFRKEIFNSAVVRGLIVCPAEVGPQLRLQYSEQPKGEIIHVAMEPIRSYYDIPRVFSVGRNHNGSWLSTKFDDPDDTCIDDFWVFVRRKNPSSAV